MIYQIEKILLNLFCKINWLNIINNKNNTIIVDFAFYFFFLILFLHLSLWLLIHYTTNTLYNFLYITNEPLSSLYIHCIIEIPIPNTYTWSPAGIPPSLFSILFLFLIQGYLQHFSFYLFSYLIYTELWIRGMLYLFLTLTLEW